MIVDVSKKILIVGLGLLGGSYARILKRFGFPISAITKEQSSIDYALKEGIIDTGATAIDETIIGEADLVIFALYPHVFVSPKKRCNHHRCNRCETKYRLSNSGYAQGRCRVYCSASNGGA